MNGILNVLKPPNMTSQDVVSYLRWLFQTKKIGHGGTLDPGAAGVLPIFIGKSTRLVDYSTLGDKAYIGEITFGISTDTQDSYGKILEKMDCTIPMDAVEAALPSFVGEITQEVPRYSAVKVKGQKLYQSAHRGTELDVPLPTRTVRIQELHLQHQVEKNRYLFSVHCSKGTYVRTLAKDLGQALGVPSHLSFLLRTRAADFFLSGAITLDEIRAALDENRMASYLMTPDSMLGHLPMVRLPSSCRKQVLQGASVSVEMQEGVPEEGRECRIYLGEQFAGIGLQKEGVVRMRKLLMEESS